MSKGHFEARKHAYRQTQDGVVVSFVIHPSDVPADLATAPLGTIYMIGFAALGDASTREDEGKPVGTDLTVRASKTSPAKPKRKFEELPPSQQAALRCNYKEFQRFIRSRVDLPSEATAEDYAAAVREWCHVRSRSEFDHSTAASHDWRELEEEYQDWLGAQRAQQQHDAYAR